MRGAQSGVGIGEPAVVSISASGRQKTQDRTACNRDQEGWFISKEMGNVFTMLSGIR